mmetsp:Transcript_118048/g.280236  ORF Transcript_118048/g.280236 Transcript_118048/m.280236 type:complete len:210 (-) Transcript_118048:775-1404(-)
MQAAWPCRNDHISRHQLFTAQQILHQQHAAGAAAAAGPGLAAVHLLAPVLLRIEHHHRAAQGDPSRRSATGTTAVGTTAWPPLDSSSVRYKNVRLCLQRRIEHLSFISCPWQQEEQEAKEIHHQGANHHPHHPPGDVLRGLHVHLPFLHVHIVHPVHDEICHCTVHEALAGVGGVLVNKALAVPAQRAPALAGAEAVRVVLILQLDPLR